MRNGVRHTEDKRQEAAALRRDGNSLKTIAKKLGAAASTVTGWVKHIHLTNEQQQMLLKRLGNSSLADAAKKRHEQWQKEAAGFFNKHRREPFFLLGIGLYWGEGSKGDQLNLTNAGTDIVLTWIAWCKTYFPNIKLTIGVGIHDDVSEDDAKEFWSTLTGLPVVFAFRVAPRSSQGKRPRRILPYGTARIVAGRGSKECILKMKVWIKMARETYVGVAQLAERLASNQIVTSSILVTHTEPG